MGNKTKHAEDGNKIFEIKQETKWNADMTHKLDKGETQTWNTWEAGKKNMTHKPGGMDGNIDWTKPQLVLN